MDDLTLRDVDGEPIETYRFRKPPEVPAWRPPPLHRRLAVAVRQLVGLARLSWLRWKDGRG